MSVRRPPRYWYQRKPEELTRSTTIVTNRPLYQSPLLPAFLLLQKIGHLVARVGVSVEQRGTLPFFDSRGRTLQSRAQSVRMRAPVYVSLVHLGRLGAPRTQQTHSALWAVGKKYNDKTPNSCPGRRKKYRESVRNAFFMLLCVTPYGYIPKTEHGLS